MARRQRNIYKRKDGRYEARFIKDRDCNGKAVYGSVYAKTYAKVLEKLDTAKLTTAVTKVSPDTCENIVQVMENYLEVHKVLIKLSTYWIYHGYIKNHIRPYFANIRCDQLSQEQMQAFIVEKLEIGLSATLTQSVYTFMKKALDGAVDATVFQICFPKSHRPKINVLTIDEQKRLELVAEASDSINRVGIILCLYTGIRVGELCGLMWQDVDFESKQLNIHRTMQRVKCTDSNAKTKIILLPPKSKSSQRAIPLPEFLLCILKEHRVESPGEYVLEKDGRIVEPRVMQYRFQRLLELAKIRTRSFHITRHCFSLRALECGFDIKTLSELLGHSSPVITLKRYAHVLDEHKRKSMDSLAVVYSNCKPEHGLKSGQ